MSTNSWTNRTKAITIAAFLTLTVVIVTVGVVLREHGPGNMGNGFLTGAGIGGVALLVVGWRISRRPERVSTFERAWTQTGDERDDAILTRAFAVLGFSAVPLTVVTTILLSLGVPMAPVLALLNFALIGVFAVAFAVIARRG